MGLEINILEWLLTGGIGTLIAREIFKSVKYRKDNGTRHILLGEIKTKLNLIGDKTNETGTAVEVVKNELLNINKRCMTHLENQQETNTELKDRLNSLDGKLYEHIKKR